MVVSVTKIYDAMNCMRYEDIHRKVVFQAQPTWGGCKDQLCQYIFIRDFMKCADLPRKIMVLAIHFHGVEGWGQVPKNFIPGNCLKCMDLLRKIIFLSSSPMGLGRVNHQNKYY